MMHRIKRATGEMELAFSKEDIDALVELAKEMDPTNPADIVVLTIREPDVSELLLQFTEYTMRKLQERFNG